MNFSAEKIILGSGSNYIITGSVINGGGGGSSTVSVTGQTITSPNFSGAGGISVFSQGNNVIVSGNLSGVSSTSMTSSIVRNDNIIYYKSTGNLKLITIPLESGKWDFFEINGLVNNSANGDFEVFYNNDFTNTNYHTQAFYSFNGNNSFSEEIFSPRMMRMNIADSFTFNGLTSLSSKSLGTQSRISKKDDTNDNLVVSLVNNTYEGSIPNSLTGIHFTGFFSTGSTIILKSLHSSLTGTPIGSSSNSTSQPSTDGYYLRQSKFAYYSGGYVYNQGEFYTGDFQLSFNKNLESNSYVKLKFEANIDGLNTNTVIAPSFYKNGINLLSGISSDKSFQIIPYLDYSDPFGRYTFNFIDTGVNRGSGIYYVGFTGIDGTLYINRREDNPINTMGAALFEIEEYAPITGLVLNSSSSQTNQNIITGMLSSSSTDIYVNIPENWNNTCKFYLEGSSTGSLSNAAIFFNSDFNSTNYHSQYVGANDGTQYVAEVSSNSNFTDIQNGRYYIAEGLISRVISGNIAAKIQTTEYRSSTNIMNRSTSICYNGTYPISLTGILFRAGTVNGFFSGTRYKFEKIF